MMKKQLFFMLIALFILGMSACKDSNNDTPDDPNNGGGGNLEVTLTAKPEIVSFVSTSTDSCKLYLEGNASWRIKATVDWCTFSKYSGEGADSVTVYVGDNDQIDKRSGEIVITGAKEPVKIPVVQFGRGVQFMTFVGGEAIPDDNVVELDFESYTYYFSFVSNVTFEATLDPATKNKWISEKSDQEGAGDSNYPGYPKGVWLYVHLDDNQDTHSRESYYVLKQSGGTATDTVYIRQKGYEPFLRFFSDTIYIGSHFRQLNIAGWGDVAWNHEFLDDNNHVTTPTWIRNVYKREAKTLSRLGTTQTLTGEVDMNESNEPRHVKVRFYYDVNGKPMENILTVIQRENNPWASDSLALMRIAEQNASEAGLTVSWQLGKPMDSWPDLGWTYDEAGNKRVDVVLLGGAHMINDLTPDICNLTAVTTLLMGRNYLTGIPKEIGMLEHLTTLDLSDNINNNLGEGPISGIKELPAEIFTGCTNLKELNLSRNRLTKVPAGIRNLTKLTNLDLSANFITEFPLEEMNALQNLEVLNLGGNTSYAGAFPEFIFDLPKLTQISLTGMNFQGAALPDRFASLPELKTMNCNFCNLGGVLPVSLSKCLKLENFSADAAASATHWIEGTLPPEYARLENMSSLSFMDNKITGCIPEEYVSFLNLYKRTYDKKEGSGQKFLGWWLAGNCMSGTIPADIVSHPAWKDEFVMWEGKEVKLSRMNPKTEICPQREQFGFTNCPVK